MQRLTFMVALAFIFWPAFGLAQTGPGQEIELIGPVGQVQPDQTFTVEIRLQTADQQVNAAEIHFHFDPQAVDFVSLSRAQSIFNLWPEEPTIDETKGSIALTGGRPGGIISYGGQVAMLTFAARQAGIATFQISREDTAVYLNDGRATKLLVASSPLNLAVTADTGAGIHLSSTTHPTSASWSTGQTIVVHWDVHPGSSYSYQLSTNRQVFPDDNPETTVGDVTYEQMPDGVYYFTVKERPSDGKWLPIFQRLFLLDQTPPEKFMVNSISGKITNGQTLLSFQAEDATSGVARYRLVVGGQNAGVVRSPLPVAAAWRGKKIVVIAEDAAGNVRSSTSPRSTFTEWKLLLLGLAIIILGLFGWWWRRSYHLNTT